jgi:hypothetical protein
MTILPDQSCRDEDDIGFDSFVDRDCLGARAEFGGEFAEGFGTARIGDEEGNILGGEEAGERRAHQPRAYDGVRHVDLHIDCCGKVSSGLRSTRH